MRAAFKLRDRVYIRTGELVGMVTGVLEQEGGFKYRVGWNDGTEGWHFGFELSEEKSFTE